MTSHRAAAAGAGLIAVVSLAALTACTGASGGPHGSARPTTALVDGPSAAGAPAVRWWSNSAVQKGSAIDLAHPDAAAAGLHESRADYCRMLRQTVKARKSILPDAAGADPAVVASAKAFLSEIESVAPQPLSASWDVLGKTLLTIVATGGQAAKVTGIDASGVQSAERVVAADAKHSCGLNLNRAHH